METLIPWSEMLVMGIILLPVAIMRIKKAVAKDKFNKWIKENKIHFEN